MPQYYSYSSQVKESIDIKKSIESGQLVRPCFLETRQLDNDYGKQDLFFYDPPIMIRGQNSKVEVCFLNSRSDSLRDLFLPKNKDYLLKGSDNSVYELEYDKCEDYLTWLIDRFSSMGLSTFGIYGAFSYDFMRFSRGLNYKNSESDFVFYFPDFVFRIDASYEGYSYDALMTEQSESVLKELPKTVKDYGIGLPDNVGKEGPINFGKPTLMNPLKVMESLENGMEAIDKGEVDQLTISRVYEVEFQGNPFDIYKRYSEKNPTTYNYYFDFPEFSLIGASIAPQLKCDGNKVSTRAIGGTVARQTLNKVKQVSSVSRFLGSEKEKNELDMLIDLAVDDLSCITNTLPSVSEYRRLSYFSKVIHTYANVSAELSGPIDILNSLGQSMPAGTVSGVPRDTAAELINQLEESPRGFYGGSVGAIRFDKTFDFALSLRGVLFKNGRLLFRVGSTLVPGSNVLREFQEAELKAKGFFDALEDCDQDKRVDRVGISERLSIAVHDPSNHKGHFYRLSLGVKERSDQTADVGIVTSVNKNNMAEYLESDQPMLFVGRAALDVLTDQLPSSISKLPVKGELEWIFNGNRWDVGGFFQSWSFPCVDHKNICSLGIVRSRGERKNYGLVYRIGRNKLLCLFDPLSVGNRLSDAGLKLVNELINLTYYQETAHDGVSYG